jgi:hypothetical protein
LSFLFGTLALEVLFPLLYSFKKESFVPFIGAGPSTVLGAADWEKLLADLCKSSSLTSFKKTRKDGKVDYGIGGDVWI